ncbi:putative cyclin-like f-box protein [Rosellinia necatrix]|uniref:Putative cyclin-like f-box protein n=1 Tax=Rosellinia necatrix TaxID=77044 RepID=A0A1S8AAR4_ROSNE|nr:putative cyclin-like f-box protein [Rosellinia necatrix]
MPARRRHKQEQPQAFRLFQQLPAELRLQIWVCTWEPRTVSLFPSTDDGYDKLSFLRPGSKNRLPTSAYVNSESRSEALRYYKRCFANRDKTDFRWFNFRLDTLCLASNPWALDMLDLGELRQVQRLIAPEFFPGAIHAMVSCDSTWPKPVTESFKSPAIKALLEHHYPSLREITLTTNIWVIINQKYHFTPQPSEFKGWGHLRTTYISGLKIRHSPSGSKTYRQRYCCRLSKSDIEILLATIFHLLMR